MEGFFIILSTCQNMNIVASKTKQITLNGITLISHIDLTNPHETYSVSYSIQANDLFEIFPKKGIIMAKAVQIITVKYAKTPTLYQLSNLQKENNVITIQVCYDNQLNKKIKKNYSRVIWKGLKDKKQTLVIPISISPQHKQLKSRLSSTLNVNTHNQSRVLTINNISVDVSSIGKVSVQQISNQSINRAKMKALIDSSSQNLPIESRSRTSMECSIENLHLIKLQEQSEVVIQQSPKLKTTRFINYQKPKKADNRYSKDPQYLLQILVLMIISGFFIALGSNIKNSIF